LAFHHSPRIITDGLIMYLDAGNIKSYPKTGNTWYDLKRTYNATIVGPSFNSNGYFDFLGQGEYDGDPTGDYISLNNDVTNTSPSIKPNGVTYDWWMKFNGNQTHGHCILYGSGTMNHMEWRGTTTDGYWRTEAAIQNGYSFGASGDFGHQLEEWFNMTVVFANNEEFRPVRWYLNGNLFYTGNMTGGTSPSTEYFRPNAFGRATGTSQYLYSESFLGSLSIFKIYDRVLTPGEILYNHIALRGRFGV